MNNMNQLFLASSMLATAGLGVYVYMNNDRQPDHLNNEHSKEDEAFASPEDVASTESIQSVSRNKKNVHVKTKRRNYKTSGTRKRIY